MSLNNLTTRVIEGEEAEIWMILVCTPRLNMISDTHGSQVSSQYRSCKRPWRFGVSRRCCG